MMTMRSSLGRRSGQDRRSGTDTRSEEEKRLKGERRLNIDRRSGVDRRSKLTNDSPQHTRTLFEKILDRKRWAMGKSQDYLVFAIMAGALILLYAFDG